MDIRNKIHRTVFLKKEFPEQILAIHYLYQVKSITMTKCALRTEKRCFLFLIFRLESVQYHIVNNLFIYHWPDSIFKNSIM